jgi:hypothetical protein
MPKRKQQKGEFRAHTVEKACFLKQKGEFRARTKEKTVFLREEESLISEVGLVAIHGKGWCP